MRLCRYNVGLEAVPLIISRTLGSLLVDQRCIELLEDAEYKVKGQADILLHFTRAVLEGKHDYSQELWSQNVVPKIIKCMQENSGTWISVQIPKLSSHLVLRSADPRRHQSAAAWLGDALWAWYA